MSSETVVQGLYLLVAAVNALPVVGMLSGPRIEQAYGVTLGSADLVLLMRHRALLFGIVAGLLGFAAFEPELRAVAAAAGLASMLGFVGLAGIGDPVGPALRRIVIIDVAASVGLAIAAGLDVA
ncbi:MAG: phosphopantetheine adenylyltransferase [Myxococcota bacterium]